MSSTISPLSPLSPPPASTPARTAPPREALAASLVTVVLWSSAFVGIRSAGKELHPGALALLRLAVAVVILSAVALRKGRVALPARRDLGMIALSGVTWFGIYNVVLNEAERKVDAGTAAMLVNIGPILIAVLAGIVLREGFPRPLVIGCAVAFLGAATIGLATAEHGAGLVGAALCLIAAAAYAVGVVAQKPVLRRVTPLHVTWGSAIVGLVVCLPFGPQLANDLHHASSGAVLWTVYLGVFPTAIAFTTWTFALSRTAAGRLAAMTYLVPPLAVGMGWAILGESPPALAFAGGAICLVGVGISRRR